MFSFYQKKLDVEGEFNPVDRGLSIRDIFIAHLCWKVMFSYRLSVCLSVCLFGL